MPNVIICANFGVKKLRSLGYAGVKFWSLPLKWMDTLTTVLRYRAACDTAAFVQEYLIINKFHVLHVNTFYVAHFAHCICPFGFSCITLKKPRTGSLPFLSGDGHLGDSLNG